LTLFYLSYVSEDSSFYALLRADSTLQDQEPILSFNNNFLNTFDKTSNCWAKV